MSVALVDDVDELADVRLEGVALVSDDPSDWLVPTSMCDHDSVFGWWQHLHHNENLWSTERLSAMQTVVDSYSPNGGLRAGTHAKVRSATERLIEGGMTWAELESISGFTPATLLGGPGWKVWQMLADGCTVDEVAAVTSENLRTIRRYQKILGGDRVTRVWPKALHAEAAALVDSGLSLSQTAKVLSDRHGRQISKYTVHSWSRRRRPQAAS